MQAPHICSQYAILSLFLGKMRNILRQPAPRIQEDKPSGLDAHFEYIDAHMVKKNGLRRRSGGPPGDPAGGLRATRLASPTDRYEVQVYVLVINVLAAVYLHLHLSMYVRLRWV